MRIRPAGWVVIALLLLGGAWFGARRLGLFDAPIAQTVKGWLPRFAPAAPSGALASSDFPPVAVLPATAPPAPAAAAPLRLGIPALALGAPDPVEVGAAPGSGVERSRGALSDAAVKAGWETLDFPSEAAALAALGGKEAVEVVAVSLPAFAAAAAETKAARARAFFFVGWARSRDALVGGEKIARAAALQGKKIATVKTSGSHYLSLFALARAGLQPGGARWEFAADHAAALEAFRSGQADAYAARELARGGLFPVLEAGPEGLVPDVLVARGDALDARRADLLMLAWHFLALVRERAPTGLAGLYDNRRFFGLQGKEPAAFVPSYEAAARVWVKAGVLEAAAMLAAEEVVDAGVVGALAGDGAGGWAGGGGTR